MKHAITLRCGTLHLRVERADVPLEQLCGFASRRSRKRGFVFVSKVLGKHYPVRPSAMGDIYERLANKLIALPGPVVFVALAETATGLGNGVFHAWASRFERSDAMFLHSTRYRLRQPLALNFDEAHSHATEHLLYEPQSLAHRALFRCAPTLVLIDDEMSSGRTVVNLALAYRKLNGALQSVHLVCLTDWLGETRRREIAREIGVPTHFHSVLAGEYSLSDNPHFEPGVVPNANGAGQFKEAYLPRNHGRLGINAATQYDLEAILTDVNLRKSDVVLVLGSGEFTYAPYLLARRLETLGYDVHFQSTTRSPLMVDCDISSVLEFSDNYHDGIANYLYNVSDRRYNRILICYETTPLPTEHRLTEMIGATCIFF